MFDALDLNTMRGLVLCLEKLGIDRDRLARSCGLDRWRFDAVIHGEAPSDVDAAMRIAMRLTLIAVGLCVTPA